MPAYYAPIEFLDHFDRSQTLSTTAGQNGWTIADTSSGGTPTYVTQNGGGLKLTLANTSEVENVCAHFGNVLPYPLLQVESVEILAKVASVSATTTLVFGIGSDRHDTPDSVATNAWFRMEGGTSTTNVVVETDDGTTDLDDKATGQTLSSTLKSFKIDFTRPSASGTLQPRFLIDNVEVAKTTSFSMAAATTSTYVQPIIQIQKTASTSTPSITIARFCVRYSKQFS